MKKKRSRPIKKAWVVEWIGHNGKRRLVGVHRTKKEAVESSRRCLDYCAAYGAELSIYRFVMA